MSEKRNPVAVEIGERIAERRKQLGWTQEVAAERCGLSQQSFACVERGIKNIRAESIIKISQAMSISTDYILTGAGSDIDRNHLVKMMEPLDAGQLKCLEEIVRNFVLACTQYAD